MEDKKRVGVWIRVSTGFQVESESPEHHEERARYYAKSKGWDIVEVYRLDAVSGKSVIDQPEAIRMLHDVRRGHIKGLIFSKLARLARNTKELLDISEIFRKVECDLISLSESIDTSTPAGRLFYTMIAAMATWEREEIAERVAASVPIRARMGKPLGGAASFGYRWQGKEIVIDEKEAPIRKLIYELYLKHQRKRTVASELNKMGYRTRNGSKFSDTTVMRLIQDPAAKGIRIANHTKSTGEGRKWITKDEKDWIHIPCPAIVSEKLWNDCNSTMNSRYKPRKKVGPRAVFLLSGYIQCNCGTTMYVYHKTPVYKCKKCRNKILVSDMDEIYHAQLKSFLLTDTDLATYRQQNDALVVTKEALMASAHKEVGILKKKLEDYIDLKIAGTITNERLKELYDPLEERLSALEKQLPQLQAEIDYLKVMHLSADKVLEEAKNLYEHWPNLPFEEKRSIVEIITNHITIGKGDITLNLSYIPNYLFFPDDVNMQRANRGSWKRSA
jgi:site-specific DNA recombinase